MKSYNEEMFPTLISIDGFHLATYGFMVALGFLAGIAYLTAQRKAMGLSERDFGSLVTGVFFSGMIGAKLLFLALYWEEAAGDGWGLLSGLRYGFVFFGGFLSAAGYCLWFCRRRGLSFWKLSDALAPALALGHALGRFGCFAAGCCYGRPSQLPWAIAFRDPDALIPPELSGISLHPTQLYEASGNLLLAVLLHYHFLKGVRRGRYPAGTVFVAYLALYSVLRFLIESLRADDRGFYALHLSVSQWVGLGLLSFAVVFWFRRRKDEG